MKKAWNWIRESSWGIVAGILVLCALLEVFVWNNHLLFTVRGKEEQILSLEEAVVYGNASWEDDAWVIAAGEKVSLDFWDASVESVAVTVMTQAEETEGRKFSVTGTVSVADDANRATLLSVQSFRVVPDGKNAVRTVRCESGGALHRLRVTLDAADREYRLTGVVVNSHSIPFAFSVLRFSACAVLLLLCVTAIRLGWVKKEYDPENRQHNIALWCVMALCMAFVLVIAGNVPVIHKDNIYAQLLQAFQEGRVYLAEGDPALDALEDVYDFSLRQTEGIRYLWDRAYYEGKYYCYFGLAPLVIYALVYALSGAIAPDSLVMALLNLGFLLLLFPTLREAVRVLKLRVNLLLFLLCAAAAGFGSFLFALQGMASFYTMPPACAAVGTLGMILATLKAENAQGGKRRALYAAAGISLAVILASRPNVCAIPLAFCLPLYIRVLWCKARSWKSRIADALAFAVPLLLGAGVVFWYNAARFGNILDFGSWYQLTAYNTGYYRLKWDLHSFGLSVYHYFLQMPGIDWQFPFFVFTKVGNGLSGSYQYYNADYAGIFMMPVNLALLLIFRALRCRKSLPNSADGTERILRWIFGLVLGSLLVVAFFDFCKAGVNLRYVTDISVGAVLLSVLLIFKQCGRWKPGDFGFGAVCVLCVLTVLSGVLFVFCNADFAWLRMNPDSYLEVADFFMGILE